MKRALTFRALLSLVVLVLVASACGESTSTVVSDGRLQDAAAVPADAEDAAGPDPSDPSTADDTEGADEPMGSADDEADEVHEADEADEADEAEFKLPPLGGEESSEGDDGEASGVLGASFLREAAEATESATGYRYEMWFSMYIADDGFEIDISPDTPLAWGEVSGASQSMSMDLGAVFEEMFAAFDGGAEANLLAEMFGDDLSMETVVDGSTMYLRAPFLAGMVEGPAGAGMPPEFGELSVLADGWGVIDLDRLGTFGAGDVTGLTGMQGGGSPDEMLGLLRDAGADVTEVGRATVRGVDTTHVKAELNMTQMLEAQGVDAAQLGLAMGDMFDVDLPFDVFVDDEGRVRRLTLSMSMDTLRQMMPDDIPPGGEFEFSTSIDLFDFGDDIVVTPPDASEITGDVTDLFLALVELGL